MNRLCFGTSAPARASVGIALALGLAAVGAVAPSADADGDSYDVMIASNGHPVDVPLILTDPLGGRVPPVPLLVDLAIAPAPAALPAIAWSATGGVVTRTDSGPGTFERSAPPGSTYVERGSIIGPFTLTARVGSPVARSITVPGFAYPLTPIMCGAGGFDGLRFTTTGAPEGVDRPADADIYVTGPDDLHAGLFRGCYGAFVDNEHPATLHVPGGAVGFTDSERRLPTVTPEDFRAPFSTTFDASTVPQLLLFRLHDGRLAKIGYRGGTGDELVGPGLVAGDAGVFADTAYARTARVERTALMHEPTTRVRFSASIDFEYATYK